MNNLAKLLQEATPLLDVLRAEQRQAILLMILENKELNVNSITEKSELSRPPISHHLKLMTQAEVLLVRKQGVHRFYRMNFDCIMPVMKERYESLAQLQALQETPHPE